MSNKNVLLAANYSNHTGYAWNNIYKLYDAIAHEFADDNRNIIVSFSKLNIPVEQITNHKNINFDEWDPNDKSLKNTFKFIKLVKKHKIGYVYFTDLPYYDLRYAIFRLSGIKKIVIHSRISVADPKPANYEGGVKGFIKQIISNINLVSSDRVYAVSDFVRDRLIKKNRVPSNKVIKILNGIDLDKFKPNPNHITPNSHITVFTCGRATDHKGIHILIEAIKFLINIDNDIQLEVRYAGDGPDFEKLNTMVKNYNLTEYFTFLGELPSTIDEVGNADILVVPSIWGDACPSSVSEALASGKPLITTRAGGIPEIVDSQENAILVDTNDPYSIFIALLALIKSPSLREKLAVNGRLRAINALDKNAYYNTVLKQLSLDFFGIKD